MSTLLISYGATLLASFIAIIMGLIAIHYNESDVMDMNFSTTATALHGLDIVEQRDHGRRGSAPAPPKVRQTRLRFTKFPEANGKKQGWGFIKETLYVTQLKSEMTETISEVV
jgi:hypothetical protein